MLYLICQGLVPTVSLVQKDLNECARGWPLATVFPVFPQGYRLPLWASTCKLHPLSHSCTQDGWSVLVNSWACMQITGGACPIIHVHANRFIRGRSPQYNRMLSIHMKFKRGSTQCSFNFSFILNTFPFLASSISG